MSISKVIRDENGKEHRIGNYAHVKNFRRKKKEQLVNQFGGKCCICGYSKSVRNLSFHHVDPSTKSFGIATKGNDLGITKVIDEAKKCILVCANCHGEIHDGLIDALIYFKNGSPAQNRTEVGR